MCGIYGAFGSSASTTRDVRQVVSRTLQHRGPDDEGFDDGDGWALGFRRLSILDLSASGHQPMTSSDRRHWLVFNGEIYNYVELRSDLERAGETFTGTSDTEVLLRLLARHGTGALHLLNGMFAFAYVDTGARQFILARDRLGVKPLYLHMKDGDVRFASELKALLAWPGAEREVDSAALAEYLALNYLPSEQCIFRGYSKISPAHYLHGDLDHPGRAREGSYWQLALNDDPRGRTITHSESDELLELLSDATRIRLRSDVSVGVFLSGGIDSGLVAALAAEGSSQPPLALTVAFDEEAHDETALATATAAHAGLPQRIVHQSAGGLSMIDEIAWNFDEPFGDPSALPTWLLCRAASEHATVFLSGDGGDEAFGGYRRYVEARRYEPLAAILRLSRGVAVATAMALPRVSQLRYRLVKASVADFGYAATFDSLPQDPIFPAIAGEVIRDYVPEAGNSLWSRWRKSRGDHLLGRQQKLDFTHYLPDDVLVKVDRASMAHSIEVRSPFLDYRVVQWAARLPRGVMLSKTEGKLPLRMLASRLLPQSVTRSRKRGFGVPLDDWFALEGGKRFAEDRLLSARALQRGWWNRSGVSRMLRAHSRGAGRRFGAVIWRLLMLDAWARVYVDTSIPRARETTSTRTDGLVA
jgi:asparagine synthase (glutamine-hydrolysing)